MSNEQVATKVSTAVKAGEKHSSGDNSDNNSDSSSTTSSQELVWAPRPYYFCNKCLVTLGLPEPEEEREGNYLIEKKAVAEVRQGKEASGSEKVNQATKRQHKQQQQQKQWGRKKTRLLLDVE